MKFFEIQISIATGNLIQFGMYFFTEYDARAWVEFTYPGHNFQVFEGTLPT